jgi:hypothetical protein
MSTSIGSNADRPGSDSNVYRSSTGEEITMRHLGRLMTTVGVATALLGSTLAAQVQKVAPAPTVVMTVVEVKAADVAKAKAVAPVAKVAGPEAVPANLDPLIQQFLPQCRPLVRSELHLVTSLCSPTKEQREKLKDEGERLAKEVVTKFAEAQNKMMQGQWRGGTMPEPRKLIEEGIPKFLKPILTPDQMKLYQAEVEKRALDKRQISVRALVARLDQIVVLSKEQREKLVNNLLVGWNDTWGRSLEQFFVSYGDQYFPTVPDALILPVLNELQKTAYRGTQKIQVNFFGGFNFNGGGFAMEEEEEAVVAPPATAIEVRVIEAKPPAKKPAQKAQAVSK